MCFDCGCRRRGDDNLRAMSIMMNSGSQALSQFATEYVNEPLSMEKLVALRFKIDPEFAPALAAELDSLIEEAQNYYRRNQRATSRSS